MAKSKTKIKYSTASKAFKVEGIPQMKKTLQALRKTLSTEDNDALSLKVKEALLRPMLVVQTEAKDMAPRKSGLLAESIHAEVEADAPAARCWVSTKEAFYAIWVEMGSSKMVASPYFRPAIAASRPMAARMIAEELAPVVAEAVRKVAWKASQGL